ncbi:MAG: hypothetical protein ABIO65_01190 [Nitrospiria bacterium]
MTPRAPRWMRGLKTWHVLWRIARPEAPSPLRRFFAPSVAVEERELPAAGLTLRVRVYRPARPVASAATLVVNGGFVAASIDDPRLKNFATALAETGFLVLTPDYPAVRTLTFTAGTIDQIHAVLRGVRDSPELGGAGPLGLIGLSYMATLGLKAALRPDRSSPPQVIGVFGGYADFRDLMHDVFRETYRYGTTDVPVDPYGRFLVLRSVVDYFDPPPEEREALRDLALRCGRREPEPAIEEAVGRLSPAGRASFHALRHFTPAGSPQLWETILRDHRDVCEALSIREPPAQLRSRLVLLHSGHDHVLPSAGSLALHRRFPAAELVLTTLFTHVNVRLTPGLAWSQLREFRHVARVFGRLMALQE